MSEAPTTVYLVTDNPGYGNPDIYGGFSSDEKAQAWITRQVERGRAREGFWVNTLDIDNAEDLTR